MLNANYSEIIAQAKLNGASYVNFNKSNNVSGNTSNYTVKAITAEKDTFTLSDAALAKMNGSTIKEIAPTYIRPETAKDLLAKGKGANKIYTNIESKIENKQSQKSASDIRFDDMMQSILDKRLGVDREKLEEIEAMMKAIAENEKLSPEAKQKALEELEKMREKVIEESLEIKKQAEQIFSQE